MSGVGGAFARVAVVVAGYVLFALVVLGGSGFLGRVLVLPALFHRIVTGALVLGLPLAAVLAWRYPSVGERPRRADAAGGE